MFVNIFLTSFSPYDIQNYVWEFFVPPNKGLFVICDTNSTQNLHRALQEDVWFARVAENLEGVHFPPHLFSSQPSTTPSLRNLKTQHVKHTSNLNATLYTFPHCNQHMCETLTHSTLHNPEHFTHHALHSHYQKYFPLSNVRLL